MQTIKKLLLTLAALFVVTTGAWAQYLKYDAQMIKQIKDSIRDYPRAGSPQYLVDQDYFVVAKAIREIAHFDAEQRKKFGIADNLYRQCFVLDSTAWAQNIECNANTMLRLYKDKDCSYLENLPVKSIGILCKCIDDVFAVNDSIKTKFNRSRPWYNFWGLKKGTDDNLMTIRQYYPRDKWDSYCLTKKDRSYPSGHSVISYASAMLLGELIRPSVGEDSQVVRNKLMKRASEFAMSRVVLGVHHYSDIQASYREAVTILNMIYGDQQFGEDTDLKKNGKFTTEGYKEIYSTETFKEVAKLGRLKAYCLTHNKYYNKRIMASTDKDGERLLDFDYRCSYDSKGCLFSFRWDYDPVR